MSKPSLKRLAAHVMSDLQKEQQEQRVPEGTQFRKATIVHRRGTTMIYAIIFGWGINLYPWWMLSKRVPLIGLTFHTPKEKGKLRDFSFTFGLGGLDVLSYRTA